MEGIVMDPQDAALLVLMFIVFGAPALALAARLAIRPVLEAIDRFREGVAVSSRLPDPRVDALDAEVRRLTKEVQRLSEAEEFQRQLMAGSASELKRTSRREGETQGDV
jgi:hypothetical protein